MNRRSAGGVLGGRADIHHQHPAVAQPAAQPGLGHRLQVAWREHWDAVYSSRGEQQVSWYQPDPRLSAELITDAAAAMAAGQDSPIIDAGGGASVLAGRLAADGFTDVTVVDVCAVALCRHAPGQCHGLRAPA